jgi:predicted alpha/beta-fold hydrolase
MRRLRHPERLKEAALQRLKRHPFRPAWWLANAHGQTIWPALYRKPPQLPPFELERFDTPDGDFVRVNWLKVSDPNAPVALLLHGLEGSAQSHYVLGTAALLRERLGWNVAALEFRGCGGEPNNLPRLYHSGDTSDLDLVARLAAERYPGGVFVVGYSLGGNIVARWLGELGEDAPVRAAAVMSPPFDLRASALALDQKLRGFYSKQFLDTLVKKVEEKAIRHPGSFDLDAVRRSKSIIEFDEVATAPIHGFRDAWDYYERCSCGPMLANIRVPTLAIAAKDDPLTGSAQIPNEVAEDSPWFTPLVTKRGGHLGFVAGQVPLRPIFWAERQIVRYFATVARAEAHQAREDAAD